ncbi:uncharacterized protein LOC120271546 [Dioscorea cayenensis subsp. rotundata]|uniref:Uncharacterized protein LOC120271546 n=1 Tax=Dioscorea cayennensis subsp. rotundata TaxID=55577 RepID=A0AB40C341_DIOCR|nr:uncharacterized protein LOC120271546 [Dioscorea cayenensis subsp. rotundata]
MAQELNLDVDGCSFYWMDYLSDNIGRREIKTDADALEMALIVQLHGEVNVTAKEFDDKDQDDNQILDKNEVCMDQDQEQDEDQSMDPDVEHNEDNVDVEPDSDLYDSDYSLSGEENDVHEVSGDGHGAGLGARSVDNIVEGPARDGDDYEIEYGGFRRTAFLFFNR